MLLFPGWELSSSFMLDQIRKQEKLVSLEETDISGKLQGSSFNIASKTMTIWSIDPYNNKTNLMEIKESPQGNVNYWNVSTICSD